MFSGTLLVSRFRATYVCVYTYTHTHVHAYIICICIVCVCMDRHVCMYKHTCDSMYSYIHTYILYLYMHMCVCVCVWIDMYTNTNIHATADGREMPGRLAGTCVAVTGMMMAIWYAKGVAQKVLEESNREDAEEGRAEEGRAGVVADGKVMISMSPAAAGLQVGGSLQLVVDDSAAKSEVCCRSCACACACRCQCQCLCL